MKTFSFDSSSSASASFRASRTATSFTPLGVAYLLLLTVVGNEAVGCKTDLVGDMKGRDGARRREAGRRRREVTMAKAVGSLSENESTELCRDLSYKIML